MKSRNDGSKNLDVNSKELHAELNRGSEKVMVDLGGPKALPANKAPDKESVNGA